MIIILFIGSKNYILMKLVTYLRHFKTSPYTIYCLPITDNTDTLYKYIYWVFQNSLLMAL